MFFLIYNTQMVRNFINDTCSRSFDWKLADLFKIQCAGFAPHGGHWWTGALIRWWVDIICSGTFTFEQVMFRDLLGGTSQVGEGGSMQWVNHQVLVKYKFQQFEWLIYHRDFLKIKVIFFAAHIMVETAAKKARLEGTEPWDITCILPADVTEARSGH